MGAGIDFASNVPQRKYAATLAEQLDQLKTDELMLRFAESRQRLSSDPYRPPYAVGQTSTSCAATA